MPVRWGSRGKGRPGVPLRGRARVGVTRGHTWGSRGTSGGLVGVKCPVPGGRRRGRVRHEIKSRGNAETGIAASWGVAPGRWDLRTLEAERTCQPTSPGDAGRHLRARPPSPRVRGASAGSMFAPGQDRTKRGQFYEKHSVGRRAIRVQGGHNSLPAREITHDRK